MEPLLWSGARALLFSLILTPICRDIFRSYRVVDEPNEARKLHRQPIPRVGGIAIALSYVLAYVFSAEAIGILTREGLLLWRLLPAALAIFAVGLIDDLWGLKPWQKLIGQGLCAGLAFAAGIRVGGVAGYYPSLLVSLPLTVFWLLLCINAFNLVDGMDGLAAGLGLFATLAIFLSALIEGSVGLALATFPLAMALTGFLCYNFNPATIFLGDSGSMLVGFLLGSYGAIWSQKSATLLAATAPLIVLSIPLLDVTLCVIRRFLRKQPIFAADRGHIHHRLLDRGLTPRQAVLLLYAGCALAAGFSLLQRLLHNPALAGLLLLLFCAVLWVTIQYLNYPEFSLARQLILGGEWREILQARLKLMGLRQALAAAATVEECWQALRQSAQDLGFCAVRLEWQGERRQEALGPALAEQCWSLRIPLGVGDFIELRREFGSALPPVVVSALADILRTTLLAKLPSAAAASLPFPTSSGSAPAPPVG